MAINESLRDDELRIVLSKLDVDKEKEAFGLVCKRWLRLQSTERRRLCARAGPHMLTKMASRFTRLHELDLSQSASRSFFPGVTDADLVVISTAFECLRVLNLKNCKGITDAGMVAIGRDLSCLQVLDISHCKKLTDKGLSAVAEGCHDLRGLHLTGCKTITDAILHALSNNCRNLEELGLQGCFKVTDSGLGSLVKGCQKIKLLDVSKCCNIGDAGVSSVSRACSIYLTTLKLLDCYKIGDESILSLGKFCKNLETLFIGGCRNVSDESIKSLAYCCGSTLENLRMDWCLNISDSSLNCIFSVCKNLEALDIGCCEEVTDSAFLGFSKNKSQLNLKILKVSNCPKITVVGLGLVLEQCKWIEYIDVRSCPRITKAICDEAGLQFPENCKVNFSGSLAEPVVLL